MSGQISLIGIKGFGFHGVLPTERKNGQEFIVDILIDTDFSNLNDEILNAVDYSKVVETVKLEIESNPVNLIETLASRIANTILVKFPQISKLKVTVHKPNAPVLVELKDISVIVNISR